MSASALRVFVRAGTRSTVYRLLAFWGGCKVTGRMFSQTGACTSWKFISLLEYFLRHLENKIVIGPAIFGGCVMCGSLCKKKSKR